MTKNEIRMTKEFQMPNDEVFLDAGIGPLSTFSDFDIRHSFVIRISSFVIRQVPFF
ncbi:MAG: hypothetical protein JXB10_12185 [Pirellulales bacterium]|nr:hypothetical protein [Pirellulales bacterium]